MFLYIQRTAVLCILSFLSPVAPKVYNGPPYDFNSTRKVNTSHCFPPEKLKYKINLFSIFSYVLNIHWFSFGEFIYAYLEYSFLIIWSIHPFSFGVFMFIWSIFSCLFRVFSPVYLEYAFGVNSFLLIRSIYSSNDI